jgi:hypothetical protein
VPIGAALYRWRSAPEPTGVATRIRVGRRSVRRLPGPITVAAAPVSTSHRISLPTRDGYSSRSQPVLRDVAGSMGGGPRRRQASRVGRGDPRRSVAVAARDRIEARASDDGQRWVPRERGVCPGALAEDEPRAAAADDQSCMDAPRAEPGRGGDRPLTAFFGLAGLGHHCQIGSPSIASSLSGSSFQFRHRPAPGPTVRIWPRWRQLAFMPSPYTEPVRRPV